MSTAFSSPEASALEREVEVNELTVTLEQIFNESHKKICIGWIRQNGFKKVCLQFPDDYLPHSNAISDSLKTALGTPDSILDTKIFILADTSYGSCCVDEIAAAHVESDSIIHFGRACRSKSSGLPVLYMYPQFAVDVQRMCECIKSISENISDKDLCVYVDIGYHHLVDLPIEENADECLNAKLKEVLSCSKLHVEVYPMPEDAKSDYEPSDDRICLFIGSDNQSFFNVSLTTKAAKWFIYDPAVNTISEKNPLLTNYIRRRYYYIEKCKDAQTLGLIVATLTAKGYLDVISRLQEMAKSRGVKTQLISVGRINPAKLANFMEIDCFVLIGCPFNNMYNSKEFYKPIVSVFEAEMALNPAWYMKYPDIYVTDFKHLLPEGRSFLEFDSNNVESQDISLISGRMRQSGVNGEVEAVDALALSEQHNALITQPKMEMMTTNTGLTFEDRTWKGLDPALGQTKPAKVQRGLSGIPIKYSHD